MSETITIVTVKLFRMDDRKKVMTPTSQKSFVFDAKPCGAGVGGWAVGQQIGNSGQKSRVQCPASYSSTRGADRDDFLRGKKSRAAAAWTRGKAHLQLVSQRAEALVRIDDLHNRARGQQEEADVRHFRQVLRQLRLEEGTVAQPGEFDIDRPHERCHQEADRALVQVEELLEDDADVAACRRQKRGTEGARVAWRQWRKRREGKEQQQKEQSSVAHQAAKPCFRAEGVRWLTAKRGKRRERLSSPP